MGTSFLALRQAQGFGPGAVIVGIVEVSHLFLITKLMITSFVRDSHSLLGDYIYYFALSIR